MPATIDHLAYPHVFDAILDHVDFDTLMVLRGLCTRLRDRADSVLFEHIALCRPLPRGHGIEARQAKAPFKRLPLLPEAQRGKSAVATKSRHRQLANTTCLDFFGARIDLRPYAVALKNLKVFRRPKALDSPIFAPTFVDVRDITNKGGIAVCSVPRAAVGVRPGCKRLVLHLDYDASNMKLDSTSYAFDIHDGVKEIVFVYTPIPGTSPRPYPPYIFGTILGLLGGKLLMHTVMPTLRRGGKITFVGVEKMHGGFLNLDSRLTGRALIREVAAIMERNLREELAGDNFAGLVYHWPEAQIKAAVPTFKTLEEWRKSAPVLERTRPEYPAPFCIDESLLVPGGAPGQYYEEWDRSAREVFERNPEVFWNDDDLDFDYEALNQLGNGDTNHYDHQLHHDHPSFQMDQQVLHNLLHTMQNNTAAHPHDHADLGAISEPIHNHQPNPIPHQPGPVDDSNTDPDPERQELLNRLKQVFVDSSDEDIDDSPGHDNDLDANDDDIEFDIGHGPCKDHEDRQEGDMEHRELIRHLLQTMAGNTIV